MRRHGMRLQNGEAPPGKFEAVAIGAVQHRLAPALGKAGDVRKPIRNAIGEHQLTGLDRVAGGGGDREAAVAARHRGCLALDQAGMGIAQQLLARRRDHRQRVAAVLGEEAMRGGCEAVARPAGIDDEDRAAGAGELQRGGEAGEAAADDDGVKGGHDWSPDRRSGRWRPSARGSLR